MCVGLLLFINLSSSLVLPKFLFACKKASCIKKLCFEILAIRFIDDSRVKTFNLAVSNYSGLSKLYLHQKSKGITDFNTKATCSIKRDGDLVTKMFLKTTVYTTDTLTAASNGGSILVAKVAYAN